MADHHHAGHRDRLRNRFLLSPDTVADHELLELLLFYAIPQKDTNGLAHELLARFGSLKGVLEAPRSELKSVPGMGETSSVLFPAMMDLIRRYSQEVEEFRVENSSVPLQISERMGGLYVSRFLGKKKEEVILVGLNAQGKRCAETVLGKGDSSSAIVDLDSVVQFFLDVRPKSVVLMHNHPSGAAIPSDSDFDACEQVRTLARQYRVAFLDNLIFDPCGDYMSFLESGYLDGRPPQPFRVSQSGEPSAVVFDSEETSENVTIS